MFYAFSSFFYDFGQRVNKKTEFNRRHTKKERLNLSKMTYFKEIYFKMKIIKITREGDLHEYYSFSLC